MAERITREQEERLRELFDAYLSGELRVEDREELVKGLENPAGEMLLQGILERRAEEEPAAESLKVKAAIDHWLTAQMATGAPAIHPPHQANPVPRLRRWWYGVAAAIVIGLAGSFGYLLLAPKKPVDVTARRYRNDLSPGGNKAVLKLSDGSTVALNGKEPRSISNPDGAAINEDNGWLQYSASKEARYNDLSTPVGAQIKLLLADGSRVWLDASSEIHYPTAFPSGNREVTITGQAYFEVAANARQPFIVHAKDQTIRVLGTHFNVNAYGIGAATVKTTLEQGRVIVSCGTSRLDLAPGEQADGTVLKRNADLEEVLAWKNGEFKFKGAPIEVIMEQLARWYGAEIRYKDRITEEFVARIPRDVPVSKVLKYLEATGQVKFMIEGNVITVMK